MKRLAAYFLIGWVIKLLVCLVVLASHLLAQEIPQQNGPLGIRPTAKEVELGRKLFFDPRLSQNGTVSCSSCHDPDLGWSDGRPVAVGILGQAGTRNSPTVINSSYVPLVFWDGRTVSTTTQALLPLSNPIEMGRQTEQQVINRLRLIPGYLSLFADVYGVDPVAGNPITGLNLAKAISAFESTVVSFGAPIDRYLAGDNKALSAEAKIGFGIFEKANCMACHKPPLFTDNLFHNNGAEVAGKLQATDSGRFSVVPANRRTNDTVRAFKTPTLREIGRTAPYMHHGQFADLRRVVLHYNAGGSNYQARKDRFTDARIRPLGLTETQVDYLVTFLTEGFASPNYPLIEAPLLP